MLYGIVGAGGFGREVMPLVEMMFMSRSPKEVELVFVTEQKFNETHVNNHLLMTMDEYFLHPAKEKYFNIAISNSDVRKRIATFMLSEGAIPFQINALNRVELANNQIGEGAIFCPFTTVTSNIKIGKFFHANIYSYVTHDCVIGDYVTFAPLVQCNGTIVIEDEVYVGAGAVIKQGTKDRPMRIGKGAIIGMGAVVTKSVSAFETVVGNPARPLIRKKASSV